MSQQRTDQQPDNTEAIANLKRLRAIADEQAKPEFVAAIDAALKALGEERDQGDKADGLKLGMTQADILNDLASRVRSTTLSPSERTRHAHALVRMSGGR